MIASIVMAAALAAGQTPVWTWTLYEGSGPVVLAHERPDTPDLLSTLECAPNSGLVKLSLYGSNAAAGPANLLSGDATLAVQASAGENNALVASLRTDQAIFARFVVTGALSLTSGETQAGVAMASADLAKLRRFADLCGR